MINKLQLILTVVVFSILFFCIITPVGLVMQFMEFDYLKIKKKVGQKTYWQKRK